MTEPVSITVLYERKFSDGNYGSEGLSMAAVASVDQSDLDNGALQVLAARLRRDVLNELAKSAASRVASSAGYELNPPSPRQPVAAIESPPDDDPEDLPY
jgi:hypothetical protein